jgi:uncharacterized HAD superfamily protein
MKIGVDIDNTLADLNNGFCLWYNKKYGGNLCSEDFQEYWLRKVIPIKKEEEYSYWKEYHDSDFFDEMNLVENAKKVIDLLKSQNEIVFITARHAEWKQKTLNFIKAHFPEDNFEVIFTGDVYGGKNKDEICRERGISIIIEDHHEKSLDYAKNGIKVILLEMPWNKKIEHENIIRIKNWAEVPKIIGEEKDGKLFAGN